MVEEWRDSIAHPVEIYLSPVPPLLWPEIRRVKFRYTRILDGSEIDTLMTLFSEKQGTMTIDADEYGDMMFRYDYETGNVTGLHIEDFESRFLKKYPEFADGWSVLKAEGQDWGSNTPWLTDGEALDYARRLKEMAYQATLVPGWPFEELDSLAAGNGTAS